MSSVREDFDSFHQFAVEKLATSEPASLDELFIEWHDRNLRNEINQAIRRGFADADAGRYERAESAMETIREEFGFAKE